ALSSAIQHADDLVARGLDPDRFLPRLSFFFDVSISFFEEIAKFRAGRRIWARVARQRYRARDPRSMQLRFHTQTAGTDLTRQQPLNNIARVAVQAMAAILGGTQSLHTDAWDEALSAPGEAAARVAISTQNILRDEALLDQVIDPLGGAYFVERHTDEMEAAIVEVMRDVEQAGGMYAAVGDGYVQRIIGEAALAWQNELDAGSRQQVGVNCFTADEDAPVAVAAAPRVCDDDVACHLERLRVWRRNRDGAALQRALDALVAAFDNDDNAYARVVDAVAAGATHGEICACVRRAVGPGVPVATI
ncbi:MAG: methylmalonyl-CoA mutase, partial [Planctomycetes bacterium]|nr:methylmalonyl-CoA mutase [Planctomycetota bacterium]